MRPSLIILMLLFAAPVRAGDKPNFVGADKAYTDRAEEARKDLARFWTGKELPTWYKPCQMRVQVKPNTRTRRSSGGGATSFAFDRGEVFGWCMTIEGPHERLIDSVIPHEVNHTILASLTRRRIPRWLDEGVAQLFEHTSEHYRHRQLAKQYYRHPWCAWRKLDHVGDYPRDMASLQAVYSTGFVVVEWMLTKQDHHTLLKFIMDKRPPSQKLEAYYGLTPTEAEREWVRWMSGRSSECSKCQCYIHGRDYHVAKQDNQPTRGQPTLFAVGNDFCIACIPFTNAYNWDGNFRAALWRRANVIKIDGMKYQQWLAGHGIRGWPAFVLRMPDGKEYVVARSYPGKQGLIAAIDRIIAAHPTNKDWEPDKKEPAPKKEEPKTPFVRVDPHTNPPPKSEGPSKEEIEAYRRSKEADRKRAEEAAKPKPKPPAVQPPPEEKKKTGLPWGMILMGAAGAAGIGLPAWAIYAYRAAKVARGLRDRLHAARTPSQPAPPDGGPPVAPWQPAPTRPAQPDPREQITTNPPRPSVPVDGAHDYSDDANRYPGADPVEHHYVVDAPTPPARHRVDTHFVNVESDNYQRAHEQARAEVARRYPGSQEILEAELSLTRQFLAGQPPGTTS